MRVTNVNESEDHYAEMHLGDVGCEANEGCEGLLRVARVQLSPAQPVFDLLRRIVDDAAAEADRARAEYFEGMR